MDVRRPPHEREHHGEHDGGEGAEERKGSDAAAPRRRSRGVIEQSATDSSQTTPSTENGSHRGAHQKDIAASERVDSGYGERECGGADPEDENTEHNALARGDGEVDRTSPATAAPSAVSAWCRQTLCTKPLQPLERGDELRPMR